MNKHLSSPIAGLVALLLLVPLRPADATICSMDSVPGATVLYPYFEVDVSEEGCQDAEGGRTLFTVRNEVETPALATVTVWSDLHVPVLAFMVYLTGYDTQTIDLKEVLCQGNLPATGSAVSNLGLFSVFGTFPGCNDTNVPGDAPVYPPGVIEPQYQEHLQKFLTGQQSPISQVCAGVDHGDEIARGYITADNSTACNFQVPSEFPYYTSGYLSLNNQLTGYFDIVSSTSPYTVHRYPGISLEADASLTGIAGGPTFYGRYNSTILGFEYSDGREPLPAVWAGRFGRVPPDPGTSMIVWREANAESFPFTCGDAPGWFPLDILGNSSVAHFDEASNPFLMLPPLPPLPPTPWYDFPIATQRISAHPPEDEGWDFGWNFLNLTNTVAPTASNSAGQAAVLLDGPLGGPFDLAQLASEVNPQCPLTTVFEALPTLPPTGWGAVFLFADGFETGDTSRWSRVVP